MLDGVIRFALLGFIMALGLVAYRVVKGPTVADRIVALDAVGTLIMGLIIIGAMWLRDGNYLAYVVILSLISFVGTVAFAKYIKVGGVIDERDPD